MRIADVHVNLRGFRRVMSQQSLDVAQIGACLQQMRGKRMAQRDVKPVSRRMQSLIQIYRRFHKFIILFFNNHMERSIIVILQCEQKLPKATGHGFYIFYPHLAQLPWCALLLLLRL